MKTIIFLITFFIAGTSLADDTKKLDNGVIVAGIIAPILLLDADGPVNTNTYICEEPTGRPFPFPPPSVSNCSGRGLRAALLNSRAHSSFRRGLNKKLCGYIANYNSCGFVEDFGLVESGRCDQLDRTIRNFGVMAVREGISCPVILPFDDIFIPD